MPVGVLQPLESEIERLQALETLQLATAVGLGSGTVDKREADRLFKELTMQAGLNRTRQPQSKAELKLRLAQYGIDMQEVVS